MMKIAQVGVRTRARALAMATTAATKKRKTDENQDLKLSTSCSRRRVIIKAENSESPPLPELNSRGEAAVEDRCGSPSVDQASASCCSSNGSSEGVNNKFTDLEDDEVETSMYNSRGQTRRETTSLSEIGEELVLLLSSDELDSTARPSEVNSHRKSTVEKMSPTDSELEEFFFQAETGLQKQFANRYNYDVVKDEPLEGRYEWVRLKP